MSIVAFKARSFDSYAQEYFLLSTEVEINAFWKRMDTVMERMDKSEKSSFLSSCYPVLTKTCKRFEA